RSLPAIIHSVTMQACMILRWKWKLKWTRSAICSYPHYYVITETGKLFLRKENEAFLLQLCLILRSSFQTAHYHSLDLLYLLHFSITALISAGNSLSKCIGLPVVG